jgi:hypothetical protein
MLKKIKFGLLVLVAVFQFVFLFPMTAYAEAEKKEVCHDKVDKAGKPVMDKKTGKPVQECKTIKVHKKLEGTEVPPAKK